MGKKGGGRVRVKQIGPKGGQPVNPLADFANSIPPEDQIFLPPKPDPNVTHIWPMSATFNMNYKGLSVIWPTYLDGNKSSRHGRRIALADAVPEPSVQDLSEALASMGVRHAVQPYKGHPGDVESRWYNAGRVLVDLDEAVEKIGSVGASGDSDGFDVDALPDLDGVIGGAGGNKKKAVIREIARRIPNLPGRSQRLETKKKEKEEEEKKDKERAAKLAASKGATSVGGTASTSGKSSKKKGKKKR